MLVLVLQDTTVSMMVSGAITFAHLLFQRQNLGFPLSQHDQVEQEEELYHRLLLEIKQ